ncbi:hypothetical protein BU24DRAFT_422040 [Aaosphaeria arxii CBS 175.79]|uniref:Zn(2)-C6 fungal-type domain-containing protein n=1 Tax=Aaosphaeria arxii CBS 175.79 TaxID=1450172 RepID=A0A6A5XSE5_9PLEO|nr:uncharacterized protein BU24DRAFT_422040 [Aaosphaeria arxii CBS 175.79]KAF2015727.1 hypothetical protein BU24DRAFT_422040 [Aaosphaeria arxii CBS 175.79]
MPKEESAAVRKKMRKGTHSCFECRRRKIRCIFPPDNPEVCSECFARGSRCIDQENANPDVVVDHRKNLRERVSRLEALVDSLLEDKTEKSIPDTSSSKTPNLTHKDTFPPTPLSSEASSSFFQQQQQHQSQRAVSERGNHVPILSAFEDALNDAEEQMKARMDPAARKESYPGIGITTEHRYTVTCKNESDLSAENSAPYNAKKERAKQALMAALPPFDKLNKVLNSNSEWWTTWRRKCSGTSSAEQTLPQFASQALAEGNIGAIGTVVLSVAICMADDGGDIDPYIEAIDRWVLSDDEYAATLEGMECLILKAKWYADVGQPRRAWLAYRKGIGYAQLMGLHRKRTNSAAHESIWWSLYHGDRFISLLLGLPYGICDSHCDLSLPDMGGEYMAPLIFINRISQIAGKVIDRNQGIAEQSFAWALQLDQELEDLWKQLDPNWIDYSSLLIDVESNAAELRERLMAQMVFHQIRVYLHLPFMLKSQANSRFTYSRNACLNGSREVLRSYQASRTGEVQPLYECKAVDFIGFTSAVLIMLGLFNFGANGIVSPKDHESDVRLIEMSIDIFRRASSEKGGKVALQSAEVLEKMLMKLKIDSGKAEGGPNDECCPMSEFVIPYFGTISIKRGGMANPGPPPPCNINTTTPNARKSFSSSTATAASKQQRMGTARTVSASSTATSPSQFTPLSAHSSTDFFNNPLSKTTTTTTTAGKPTPASDTTSINFNNNPTGNNNDPFISYDGFYNFPTTADPTPALSSTASQSADGPTLGSQINDDSMNNFPLPTNNFSWQNMPMDIDQDWSWFLNDAASPAAGNTHLNGGSGAAAGMGQQHQHQQQQQMNELFGVNPSFLGFG